MNISDFGWKDFFRQHIESFEKDSMIPARVCREYKNIYHVVSEAGELTAEVSGRFRHEAQSRADFPAVGDWVAVTPRSGEDRATIHKLLPRRSSFSRKAVLSGGMPDTGGKTDEQVLAANVDTVFLVSGLDGDYNIRRIERYLTVAWDSGAAPVVVLNKADLCPDIETVVDEIAQIAIGVPVLTVSAARNEGMDEISTQIQKGKTAVFLGSSGVGKSTIINRLLGEERLRTQEVRADDQRGRHTTTHRELLLLPSGGIVIDTPGLRELQLWDDEAGLSRTFADIEELAGQCRFNDCRHESEPGCAVKEALKSGRLDESRFHNYLKMQKELKHLKIRKDIKAQRQTYRDIDKRVRRILKEKNELKKKGLL